MDPIAALNSILCGHEVADHADALRDWLSSGGFQPECILSIDCDAYFARHCSERYGNNDPRRMKANGRGVWSYDEARDDWWLVASWSQLIDELDGSTLGPYRAGANRI
jgi:hypothetical protein